MTRILSAALFQQAALEGGLRCAECDEIVDMEEAETMNDAVEIWNEHVRETHPDAKTASRGL